MLMAPYLLLYLISGKAPSSAIHVLCIPAHKHAADMCNGSSESLFLVKLC